MKTVSLKDFLTDEEILRAIKFYKTCSSGAFARTVDEQIITPNILRINKALGQENDPRYLAYVVERVLMEHILDIENP
jgi:hypothetical protein